MLHRLARLLLLLGKVLLLPVRLIEWLEEAITGARRKLQEKRKSMQERPPLPDQAFVEQLDLPPDQAPVALATRCAVAQACGFPPTALHPDDTLDTLRSMMTPGPDAHWLDLGPDWLEVLLHIGQLLGISLFGDPLDELFQRWDEAERNGELKNLGQLVRLLADFVRVGATASSSSAGS
jgi:hypothetical protein